MDKVRESMIGQNGITLYFNSRNGLWVTKEGDSGYHAWFTGAWVCYKCGHLCECGEGDSE
jgi:rubrerythrin